MLEPRLPRPPPSVVAPDGAPKPVNPVAAGLLNVFAPPNPPKADPMSILNETKLREFLIEQY